MTSGMIAPVATVNLGAVILGLTRMHFKKPWQDMHGSRQGRHVRSYQARPLGSVQPESAAGSDPRDEAVSRHPTTTPCGASTTTTSLAWS